MTTREKVGEPEFVAFVGIDWADQKHVWCLQAANSAKREGGELEHKPEVVEAWGRELSRRFGRGPIAVAVGWELLGGGRWWGELKGGGRAEGRKFFRQHRGRHPELTEWRLQGIGQAMSAIRDRAVIEAKRMVVQVIARLLRTLLEGIAALDDKITEAAEAHPDFFIFQSLP